WHQDPVTGEIVQPWLGREQGEILESRLIRFLNNGHQLSQRDVNTAREKGLFLPRNVSHPFLQYMGGATYPVKARPRTPKGGATARGQGTSCRSR
ncbi:unnamed protein product, partial [Discosporangium mesarthrocarpum]